MKKSPQKIPQWMAKPAVSVDDRAKSQKVVRETDEFLSCLLLYSPNPILILNADTSIRYVNPLLEHLTGFSFAELIGRMAPHPWWTERTRCQTREDLKEVMRQGATRLEEIFQKKNGEQFYVEITSTPIIIDGEVKYYLANWIDITQRKRMEELLRESEQMYKTLTESSLTGVFIHQDRKYAFVNDEFVRMHGYSRKELAGKSYLALIHPDDRETVSQIAAKRLAGKPAPQRYEVRRLRKNGTTIWCEMMATSIEYLGKPAIMGNLVNINTRKQVEEALKESEEKYRVVFENARDGIVLIDIGTGSIADCNSEFERQTGRDIRRLRKMKIWEIRPKQEIAAARREFIEIRKIKDREWNGVAEIEIQQPGGIVLPVELVSNRITIQNQEYLQSIVRDITERKQAEEALRIAEEQYKNLLDHCGQAAATLDTFEKIVRGMGRPSKKGKVSIPSPLNQREFEILRLASKGMSNKDIAQNLSISERTVGAHFRSTFAKMAVSSRTEAIYKALKDGWIDLS